MIRSMGYGVFERELAGCILISDKFVVLDATVF